MSIRHDKALLSVDKTGLEDSGTVVAALRTRFIT